MNTENESEKFSIGKAWQDVKKYRKLYYKVLPITFVVAAILMLGTPNTYQCTVKLAPELSGAKSSNSLASIASSFGINLGSGNTGSEALFPTLYPDLMNSSSFRASLFPIKVHRLDEDSTMTYYDYLNEGQKKSLVSYVLLPLSWLKEAIASIFSSEEEEDDGTVDPFMLTEDQFSIVETIEKLIVCDVDKKTLVITIDVTDQDPLIAATMADSVQLRLQRFITDYRTQKARIDLAYYQTLCKEAEARYEKARVRYASFSDANRNLLFENSRSERTKLENDMQLQYQAYSQMATQMRLAEAKVQEDTPAFTTIQPATVPVKKAGPKRARNCLIFLFLAFLGTTAYVLYKEGDLQKLLNSDEDEEEGNVDVSDLIRLLAAQKADKDK